MVKGLHDNLLSCNTALKFRVIFINRVSSGESVCEPTSSQLAEQFPSLFSDNLGCLVKYTVRLDVEPDVNPVRQPQRPVPFNLREQVGAEIMKQVEQGIIERVDRDSGPTPLVSNLVIVPKERPVNQDGGAASQNAVPDIRITCDSRAMNNAIRRTKFPTKTIEDLVYLVQGAKVFSKLDIKKAFHQIPLAEESSNLTTIITHLGLFRYTRLHMGISCASEIFSEALRVMLEGLQGQVNMADEILVFGTSREDQLRNLRSRLIVWKRKDLPLTEKNVSFLKKK